MLNRSTMNVLSTLILAVCMITVTACSNSSSSNDTGSLSIGLTDAASDDYAAVYVTIDEVQVHTGDDESGAWSVVASPNKTYNLLELVNGVIEQLGVSPLSTGHYTQVRLIVGSDADTGKNILNEDHPWANYIIDHEKNVYKLKIPSGYETGIKLVHAFDVTAGLTTELVLDFDADTSVVKAGSSGNWILKPTIKVIDTIDNAIVDGVITDDEETALQGVLVSAQVYDPDTGGIVTYTSTLTDEYGEYLMYLQAGTYSLVAYKDGYSPVCSALAAANNEDYEQSFTLSAAAMDTITCNLTASEQVVTIQFLQESPCEADKLIVVKSINVSESGTYVVDLPEGTYRVSASDGTTTLPAVTADTGSTVHLEF